MIKVVIMLVELVMAILGMYWVARDYAKNSLGEMKYMLRMAKERQKICYREGTEKEIERLESEIENFWGNKLVKSDDISRFDNLK